MVESRIGLVARTLAADTVGSVLFFPVWWYTAGALRFAKHRLESLRGLAENLGTAIWIKNLFTPMYGYRDFLSRIVSLILRFVVIVSHLPVLAVWAAVQAALCIGWLLLPLMILRETFRQLAGIAGSFGP